MCDGVEEAVKGGDGDDESKGISRGQTKNNGGRNNIGGDRDGSSCMSLGML